MHIYNIKSGVFIIQLIARKYNIIYIIFNKWLNYYAHLDIFIYSLWSLLFNCTQWGYYFETYTFLFFKVVFHYSKHNIIQ